MAWTSPRTWAAAAVVTAAQMNAHVRDNFKALLPLDTVAYSTYVPTLTQSATVTKTVNWARYQQFGKTIHGQVNLSITGSGTASNAVVAGLPVATTANLGTNDNLGVAFIYDASATTKYRAFVQFQSTTSVRFLTLHSTSDNLLGVVDFTAGLAVNDVLVYQFTYEAA